MALKGIDRSELPDSLREYLKNKGKKEYTMGELKQALGVKRRKYLTKYIDELVSRDEMKRYFSREEKTMKYRVV